MLLDVREDTQSDMACKFADTLLFTLHACVLFATAGYHGCNPGVLVSCPLARTRKSLGLLWRHANKEHYKTPLVKFESFLLTTSSPQQSIEYLISRALAKRVIENCHKLGSFV